MSMLSYYCYKDAVNCTRLPRLGYVGSRSGHLASKLVHYRYKVSKAVECAMMHGQGKPCRRRVSGKAGLYSSGSVDDVGGASKNDRDRLTSRVGVFVDKNFIPLALLCAASIGWIAPSIGLVAAKYNVHKLSTMGQFVISGLILQWGQVAVALRSPLAIVYGVVSTLFITPLLGMLIMKLPVDPFAFKVGMTVFCCVPTTLSSCVALTSACNGNAAVALMLVVLTCTFGVVTIPGVLNFVLGSSSIANAFDQTELLKSLVVSVLLPLCAGILLQTINVLSKWKDENKRLLSRLSTLFLCLTPWVQLSFASAANLPISAAIVLTALGLGVGVHIIFLAFNMTVVQFVRFNEEDEGNDAIRKAVVLCTSEKTLPVSVAVLNQLGGLLGASIGFAVLPCVFSHIIQTIIDSALVSYWNREGKEYKMA